MMFAALLSLPMRYSNFSVSISVEARDALMSCTQDVSSSLGINNLRERFWVIQTRHVLCFESQHSPYRLWSERGNPVSVVLRTVM